jgi:hypothetical protein
MAENHRFAFNEDGKFKIAQFTDLHLIYRTPTEAVTIKLIKNILREEKPDIAIVTGDIANGAPDRDSWTKFIAIFEEVGIPFAVTLGNHDAEDGTNITRAEIFGLLGRSPWFVGKKGPGEIHGIGNYVLPVYGKKNNVASLLYCFDSGAYSSNPKAPGYAAIQFDQITWYNQQSNRYTSENEGKPLPALAFLHIPLPEYRQVFDKKGIGSHGEIPCPPDYNTGLFASFLEKQDVMGVFVGHDHRNDYIGVLNSVALAYGRTTGAGTYGDLECGARIIELYENEFVFDTWIRTPKGIEQLFKYPASISNVEG